MLSVLALKKQQQLVLEKQSQLFFLFLTKDLWDSSVTMYNCLPDQVSMELNVQSLAVSLCTELFHGSAGGAEHQLQVCLGSRGGLRAGGW